MSDLNKLAEALEDKPDSDGHCREAATLLRALKTERDALREDADDLRKALSNYMQAVDIMNAAMKDGVNVHGAISALIAATEYANAAIAAGGKK